MPILPSRFIVLQQLWPAAGFVAVQVGSLACERCQVVDAGAALALLQSLGMALGFSWSPFLLAFTQKHADTSQNVVRESSALSRTSSQVARPTMSAHESVVPWSQFASGLEKVVLKRGNPRKANLFGDTDAQFNSAVQNLPSVKAARERAMLLACMGCFDGWSADQRLGLVFLATEP